MAKKIIFHSTNRSDFSYTKNIIFKLSKNYETHIIFYDDNKKEYLNLKKEYSNNKRINIIFLNNSNSFTKNIIDIIMKVKPDFNFIVGDRKEMVRPTLASHYLDIPILHLGGGESTKNSPDDNYRNIISKLSCVHFCSTKFAKYRLNKIGISKKVYLVGVASYEELSKFDFSINKKILKKYDLYENKIILFSFHSESFDLNKEMKLIKFTIKKLIKLKYKVVITSSNNDFNGHLLNKYFSGLNNNNILFLDSIGSKHFKYFIYNCKFMIGNSSSGIIESIFFNKLNLSLGNRQIGRDHDKNTFFLKYNFKLIEYYLKNIENKIMDIKDMKYIYKNYKSSNVINNILNKICI